MERYTIYCTEEQTKKALELGAPIAISDYEEKESNIFWRLTYLDLQNGLLAEYPTAEQMIGWIEAQPSISEVSINLGTLGKWYYSLFHHRIDVGGDEVFASRKEATLAAIDSALDYLIKNKK